MALLGSSWPIMVKKCLEILVQNGCQNWPLTGLNLGFVEVSKKISKELVLSFLVSFLSNCGINFGGHFGS